MVKQVMEQMGQNIPLNEDQIKVPNQKGNF